MKTLSLFLLLFAATSNIHAQKSEDFIPLDAVTVFSINNFALLQKVSLDDLVKYEFMQELQQELFDGSTAGKTIKESGIDFEQKLNVYYGKNEDYEVSGFSFAIKDIDQLFTVFDDFDEMTSPFENLKFYSSYFNHLIIQGNIGVLIRVEPLSDKVYDIADSIWNSRGYGPRSRDEYFEDYFDEGYEDIPEDELDEYGEEVAVEPIEKNVYNVDEELAKMEETGDLYSLEQDIDHKNFAELKDSIYAELNQQYLMKICKELFVEGKNLKKSDKVLADQLEHSVEGIFYLDNSRNLTKTQPFWYYQQIMPSLVIEVSNLYSNNKIIGDIQLKDQSIEVSMTANYGDALGSIYKELNSSKFDKKVTKYIHKDNAAYFTYNIDLRKAYDKTYEVVMPILRKEKSRRVSSSVLMIEMVNAFIDKDAVFDTYRGSMFGTFNGIKMVPVKRIVYSYDDDFNFSEEEVIEEEEIPIFALGFSTKRNDIPAIFMEQMSHMNSEWQNMGRYWKIDNAILNSLPLYIINRGGLFIMTNDENLAVNNPDGFGSDKISKKQIRKNKKSGFVYGQVDWSKTIENIPQELLTQEQMDILNAMRTKSGNMVLTSSKTSLNKTDFKLVYEFKDKSQDTGKHILDLVNSLYVIMK